MFDLAVTNAKIVTDGMIREGNLYVKDGKIAAITDTNTELKAEKTIDTKGKYVIPGVVDEHVHIIDMGLQELGRYEMDSAGAAICGITTILEMPVSKPVTATLEAFQEKMERASTSFCVDYGLYGAAVPGNLEELEKMHDAGAIGFKCFMVNSAPDYSFVDDGELLDIFDKVKSLDSIIAIHAESAAIIERLESKIRAEGRKDIRAFFDSRPIYAENSAVQRAVFLQERSNARTLIVHASNPEAVRIVQAAKRKGLDVHVETGPHYLCLNEDTGKEKGPYMRFAPPARSKDVTEALWNEVAKGNVETIGSDHGGHTKETKESGWKDIWGAGNGALGLETSLPVMLSEGVNGGRISIQQLVEIMCENPAKLFKIYPKKGTLSIGADADFNILDLEKEFTIDASKFKSFQKHSPFDGFSGKGLPVLTAVRGKVVAENGELKISPGYGKMIRPLK